MDPPQPGTNVEEDQLIKKSFIAQYNDTVQQKIYFTFWRDSGS
ncbi:hypothetical protein [Anaerobacillus arseniciselenatis]|nr:hypothetical protein [Anaerobacillus arseniciselenatis]